MKNRILILCATLMMVGGCQSGDDAIVYRAPEFKSVVKGSVTPVSENIPTAALDKLYSFGDYFVVIADIDDKLVHLYDKASGKLVHSAVNRGRSHNELVNVSTSSFDQTTGELLLVSAMEKKIMSVQVLESGELRINKNFNTENLNRSGTVFRIGSDKFLTFQTTFYIDSLPRLYITSKGKEIAAYHKQPFEDKETVYYHYGLPPMGVSPNKDKVVVGTAQAEVLETFSLKNNEIEALKISYFAEPLFFKSQEDLDKINLGYSSFTVTQDYIYAIYSGTNYGSGGFNKIAKLDWDHTPLELIETEGYVLRGLCVDNGKFYATVINLSDGESMIVEISKNVA